MRAYLACLRGSVLIGLAYRLGFIFVVLGNVIYIAIAYYLWRSIYAGRALLHGLTFDQAMLYVALGSTVFILLKTFTDWGMSHDIRDGTIAVYLTKPVDYQLYTFFINLGFPLTSLFTVALPTAAMLAVFQVNVTPGLGDLFFPVSLLLAYIVSFHFDYIVGLMSFYTESIWGISMTKEVLLTVLSGAFIPLQFFPVAAQRVLGWLPFPSIYFTPLMMVTQPDQGAGVFLTMLGVQAFWAAVTFGLCRLVYAQAVKVLRIAGG